MKTLGIFALAATALTALGASPSPAPSLLQHALDPNPTLNSYVAAAALSADLHAVIPLHKDVTGTAYYLRPRRTIVLDGLTGPLSRFRELSAAVPAYGDVVAQYSIKPVSDDGTTSTILLTPSGSGRRVKTLTVKITDATGLIAHAQFLYTNGGTLSVTPAYGTVGTFALATSEAISARFPGYSVDGTLRLTHYQPNAPVSPSVFATP